jgi:hypothetical protein
MGWMELHGLSFVLCIGMGMAANINGVCLMKMASRGKVDQIRMTRKIFGKLLEEATEV